MLGEPRGEVDIAQERKRYKGPFWNLPSTPTTPRLLLSPAESHPHPYDAPSQRHATIRKSAFYRSAGDAPQPPLARLPTGVKAPLPVRSSLLDPHLVTRRGSRRQQCRLRRGMFDDFKELRRVPRPPDNRPNLLLRCTPRVPARCAVRQEAATTGGTAGGAGATTATAPSLLVAEFDYAAYPTLAVDTAATFDLVGEFPKDILQSRSSTGAAGVPGDSTTTASFLDVSGDGLPEVLRDDMSVQRFLWDDPDAPDHGTWLEDILPSGISDPLERTVSARCGGTNAVSLTMSRLIDINGDGFQDLVEATGPEPATAYYPYDQNDSRYWA